MVPEVWEVDAPLMAECNPERADGARQSAFWGAFGERALWRVEGQ